MKKKNKYQTNYDALQKNNFKKLMKTFKVCFFRNEFLQTSLCFLLLLFLLFREIAKSSNYFAFVFLLEFL